MAEPEPDFSEVSYADASTLGEEDLQPKPPPAAAAPLTDSAGMTADYTALLTEDVSSETAFGRAAIKLEAARHPEPVHSVSDEQGLGFNWNELPVVLSHYDLGTIKRLEVFKRGSRRAPKAVMSSDRGVFLLKRRQGTDETRSRIITAHRVQRQLLAGGYPTPSLVPTRRSGSTLVHVGAHVYELFEFVRGEPFDRSAESAGAGGRALGRMHKLLADFAHAKDAPRGSFHQSPVVPRAFERAHEMFAKVLPASAVAAGRACLDALQRDAQTAADLADACGAADGPDQINHGDWHPGNMLYSKDSKIIGVVDYDSIRLQNPLLDLANGALQFSAIGGVDPSQWPDDLDVRRFASFVCGYSREMPVTEEKIAAIPWLMAEALTVEALLPIASRGAFAGVRGDIMLSVVQRKMDWLMTNAKMLNQAVAEVV